MTEGFHDIEISITQTSCFTSQSHKNFDEMNRKLNVFLCFREKRLEMIILRVERILLSRRNNFFAIFSLANLFSCQFRYWLSKCITTRNQLHFQQTFSIFLNESFE